MSFSQLRIQMLHAALPAVLADSRPQHNVPVRKRMAISPGRDQSDKDPASLVNTGLQGFTGLSLFEIRPGQSHIELHLFPVCPEKL